MNSEDMTNEMRNCPDCKDMCPVKETDAGDVCGRCGYNFSMCQHQFIPADNDGVYGQEECRFCGKRRHQ